MTTEAEGVFAVTRWAVPVVSWLAGFGSALIGEHIKNRRRLRSVAAILLAEAGRLRIDLELTRKPYSFPNYKLSSTVPTVHSWVHASMGQAADLGIAVLRKYMALDHLLLAMQRDLAMIQHASELEAQEETASGAAVVALVESLGHPDLTPFNEKPFGEIRDLVEFQNAIRNSFMTKRDLALAAAKDLEATLSSLVGGRVRTS
jgi:hypothetical protein